MLKLHAIHNFICITQVLFVPLGVDMATYFHRRIYFPAFFSLKLHWYFVKDSWSPKFLASLNTNIFILMWKYSMQQVEFYTFYQTAMELQSDRQLTVPNDAFTWRQFTRLEGTMKHFALKRLQFLGEQEGACRPHGCTMMERLTPKGNGTECINRLLTATRQTCTAAERPSWSPEMGPQLYGHAYHQTDPFPPSSFGNLCNPTDATVSNTNYIWKDKNTTKSTFFPNMPAASAAYW